MSALSMRGRSVLVHAVGPRVAETVHALVADGARVDVVADDGNPVVVDLAARGLLTIVGPEAITDAATTYDVIVRDPAGDESTTPATVSVGSPGTVTLVGGGPGPVGLLTVEGLRALQEADVVIADRLAPLEVLSQLSPSTEVVHVGKIPRGASTSQEAINDLLVTHAHAGRAVVRLKGGDGFVFGRGGEEWLACSDAGIPVRVVPGVSSAIAAPALAGIPVTHRSLSQGFAVVSAHVAPGDPRSEVDWAALARSGLTLVVLMGVATLGDLAATLIDAGLDAGTPAATIAEGGMPGQRTVRAPLGDLADAVQAAGLGAPATTVIGAAVDALAGRAGDGSSALPDNTP